MQNCASDEGHASGDGRRWRVQNIEKLETSEDGDEVLVHSEGFSPESIVVARIWLIRWMREQGQERYAPDRITAEFVRWLRRMTYQDPEEGGPECDERIVEIVRRYRDGATIRQLAALARVSKSSMDRILKGTARLPFDAADLPEILAA